MQINSLIDLLRGVWRRRALLPVLLLASCIDRFEPKVAQKSVGYLVIDGAINAAGVSTIRLSRTQNLGNKTAPPAEIKANVFIEQEAGTRYPLAETAPGTYTSAVLTLSPDKRYRLFVRSSGQREYASDFVQAKITPAIDSVTWQISDKGLQFYVNAHDAANNTRYYRWDYEETWDFNSAFRAQIELRNNRLQLLTEDINHCWATARAPSIKLSSTVKLTQDVVTHYPLTLLPSNSTKLQVKYSILVRQYALTAAEFAYWELLQKNTESLGTLFDPLPSQLVGNVHALSDASETVIGFVGVQSVTEQRLFIDRNRDLPRTNAWLPVTGYESCVRVDTILVRNPTGPQDPRYISYFKDNPFAPIEFIDSRTKPAYSYSTAECVDCRKRGTNKQPDFWK
ncbi:DUF4249 domain-containing protein [Hymenobacter sp. BT491]|uniref:DUF4249 domain-containing protein n=1 Tax=Hymenobacter sp. BT491 TaxID=2766779 RepID=UPI00165373FA|nr:DUF4249 domain-containing protein [Hymenobacter sp. BT491]MBC6988091.1 DUF4249 domain-containing protein [Hymenobacter sp. BT491]